MGLFWLYIGLFRVYMKHETFVGVPCTLLSIFRAFSIIYTTPLSV